MSDANDAGAQDTSAPAPQATPEPKQTAPAPQPPPAPAPAPQADDKEPAWLASRLQRERAAALKELGIDGDPSEARELLKQHRERSEKDKSEVQRLTEAKAKAEEKAARAAELDKAVEAYANRELAKLDKAKQEAVRAIAGSDHAKVLSAIEALTPTWEAQAAGDDKAAADAKATPPQEPPKPTAPGRNAPPADSAAPPDAKSQYESLKQSNPFMAFDYWQKHRADIHPDFK